MSSSHQDIDSILAKVLKQCVLRLAPGSEEMFRKLENHTGSYKEDLISRRNRVFLSFLSGLICFALLL